MAKGELMEGIFDGEIIGKLGSGRLAAMRWQRMSLNDHAS